MKEKPEKHPRLIKIFVDGGYSDKRPLAKVFNG
jgi:hypothetical protein